MITTALVLIETQTLPVRENWHYQLRGNPFSPLVAFPRAVIRSAFYCVSDWLRRPGQKPMLSPE